MNRFDRRSWLRSAFSVAGATLASPLIASELSRGPVSNAEASFLPDNGQVAARLNLNENPLGVPTEVTKVIREAIKQGNRYPFDEVAAFRKILAEHEGVTPEHIHLGAGSGHLLCQTGVAFGMQTGSVVSANPTFPILMNYAEGIGTKWKKVEVNERLEHDYEAMASAIESDTRLVFVCNPNNPTGTFINPDYVKAFCETVSAKVPVFSDEAYVDYLPVDQQRSMVELVKQDKNVVVSRTFSKIFGLAGLRIGYLIGRPDLIRKINQVGGSMEISWLGVEAAKQALKEKEFINLSREVNRKGRQILTQFLDSKKIFYGKSETNFVIFPSPAPGKEVLQALKSKGYLIRMYEFKSKEWCRVSIGTEDQMKGFVAAYAALYA